ncbi:TPA: hypothetical protein ACKRTJ_001342 [Proteus mirabilis]|nr:hypothetical protein [Proteus mirabilis]MCU9597196.1 hypothetical protein [Proteus mirabilis]MDL4005036.1 hypothetical protein [Proteus mirabilis]MDM3589210.1 hypothetical protein [Proteus mirabilis]MDM3652169.1 hypothetical protein [Proteus mirabilis]MDM3763295.1 hypothetical protein [Proteus mirabilis]
MKYHSLLKNLFYATFSIMALNFSGVTMAKNTMNDIYVINLSSNDAGCGIKINELLVSDNTMAAEGSYSTGQNISSILANGKNTLGIIMFNGSVFTGEEKLTPDMWCEVELKKLSANGDTSLISGLRLNGNNDGKMVVSDKYQNNSEQIYFGGPSRDSEFDVLEGKNQFNIQGLPQWQWEKATPVTEDDIPKIRAFYAELRQAFIDKNLDKLKTMGKISWEEMAYADNGSPDIFWKSLNFQERLEQGYRPNPISWEKYILSTYLNHRIFRYEAGFERLSPIELVSPEGKNYFYNPYLSIIDGKVTIVR